MIHLLQHFKNIIKSAHRTNSLEFFPITQSFRGYRLEFLQDEVFVHPIQVQDGHYVTPKSYGWGLEMKNEFFDSHVYPTGDIWKDRVESGSITFLP